jgi:hypothetical protein
MKKNIIRKFLDKNEKLDYLQRCIRQINNNDFVKTVMNYQKNPMIVEFESLGPLNKNKNICIFENEDRFAGFFAIYRFMLDSLYFSDKMNFTPVVNYTHCIYAEKKSINGSTNPFEYYFSKVSDVSLEEAYSSKNVVICKPVNRGLAEQLNTNDGYRISEEYINSMAIISNKYIRLNPSIEPKIMNDIKNILKGKKTIGVHIRGTDFKLKFKGHPVAITSTEYLDIVEEVINKYKYDQVFLATDELSTINLFKNTFGDKLVYYEDVMRSDDKISVAFTNSERYNHHYLLGLEVLRDMFTLANCDALIAGMSQVSICARITKASQGKNYEYIQIVDKGINDTKNLTQNYNKFMKTTNKI